MLFYFHACFSSLKSFTHPDIRELKFTFSVINSRKILPKILISQLSLPQPPSILLNSLLFSHLYFEYFYCSTMYTTLHYLHISSFKDSKLFEIRDYTFIHIHLRQHPCYQACIDLLSIYFVLCVTVLCEANGSMNEWKLGNIMKQYV